MKVFYENMRVKVDKAIEDAASRNMVIDRIELTSYEFSVFMKDAGLISRVIPGPWQPGFSRELVWRDTLIVEKLGK